MQKYELSSSIELEPDITYVVMPLEVWDQICEGADPNMTRTQFFNLKETLIISINES